MTTNKVNIDIATFLKKFNEEYDFLYNANSYVCGYKEAVSAFDDFLTENSEFVKDFIKYRGDLISSDREAASFMFALDSFI